MALDHRYAAPTSVMSDSASLEAGPPWRATRWSINDGPSGTSPSIPAPFKLDGSRTREHRRLPRLGNERRVAAERVHASYLVCQSRRAPRHFSGVISSSLSRDVVVPQADVSSTGARHVISPDCWATTTCFPSTQSQTYTSWPWVAEPIRHDRSGGVERGYTFHGLRQQADNADIDRSAMTRPRESASRPRLFPPSLIDVEASAATMRTTLACRSRQSQGVRARPRSPCPCPARPSTCDRHAVCHCRRA